MANLARQYGPPKKYAKAPSELSDNELDVLVAGYVPWGTIAWLPVPDQFMISSGMRTRAGRALRSAGYIRQKAGSVIWLPAVAGAGKRKTDSPARGFEITPDGVAALHHRMGDDSFAQLQTLCAEWRERNR